MEVQNESAAVSATSPVIHRQGQNSSAMLGGEQAGCEVGTHMHSTLNVARFFARRWTVDIQRVDHGPARPVVCVEAPPMSSEAGGSSSRRRDNSRGVCRAGKRFEAATAGAFRAVAQQLRTSGASELLTTL